MLARACVYLPIQARSRCSLNCLQRRPLTTSADLTHTDKDGKASMVDVSGKAETVRVAVAEGFVLLGPDAFAKVKDNSVKKGDVLAVAKLAGIMGAKQTSALIPLCHNISIKHVGVQLSLDEERQGIHIVASAKTEGSTGVEMEALTAVSIAGLTIYDMCKAVTHDMTITDVRLVSKSGGVRGNFER